MDELVGSGRRCHRVCGLTDDVAWSGVVAKEDGIGAEGGGEVGEQRGAALEPDHRVRVVDLHGCGDLLDGDTLQTVRWKNIE